MTKTGFLVTAFYHADSGTCPHFVSSMEDAEKIHYVGELGGDASRAHATITEFTVPEGIEELEQAWTDPRSVIIADLVYTIAL